MNKYAFRDMFSVGLTNSALIAFVEGFWMSGHFCGFD